MINRNVSFLAAANVLGNVLLYPSLAALALLAGLATAQAQTTQDHETHHPQNGAPRPAAAPAIPPARSGGMDMDKMTGGNMMGGDMASMMQRMRGGMMPEGMMQEGMGRMRALQHIEGVVAYYKAELHITDVQAEPWNAFADAVRGSAARLRQAMASAGMASGPQSAPQQMENRIALLSAQLDAMKSVQAAAKPLYAALSEEQKKIADELMAEHFMAMRAGGL